MPGETLGWTENGVQRRMPLEVGVTYLENIDLYHEIILNRVLNAATSVWIATANAKDLQAEVNGQYESLIEKLARRSAHGLEVRFLHAGKPSSYFMESLYRQRAFPGTTLELRQCPRLHYKAIVVDGAGVYLGSANWTGAGLGAKMEERRNFEIGTWSEDPRLVREVASFFDLIWTGEFCPECGRRDICPQPLDLL